MKSIKLSVAAVLMTFLGLSLWSSEAYAECSGVNCNDVRITRVYVNGANEVSLHTDGTEAALTTSCTYLTLRDTNANYESTYKLILAMFLSDRAISVKMATGTCFINYVYADK